MEIEILRNKLEVLLLAFFVERSMAKTQEQGDVVLNRYLDIFSHLFFMKDINDLPNL